MDELSLPPCGSTAIALLLKGWGQKNPASHSLERLSQWAPSLPLLMLFEYCQQCQPIPRPAWLPLRPLLFMTECEIDCG